MTLETAAKDGVPARGETMALGRGTRIAFLIVLIAALASLYPFGSLIVTSILPPLNGQPLELWQRLFSQIPVGTFMLNSAIVAGGAMVLVSIVSCMAGYGFSKLPFPGSAQLFAVLVAALSVPQATTIISNYFNFAAVGGVGAYWGPILMYAAGSTPFSVILMTNFFKALPDELVESAVIDGASYRQVFLMIMAPLAAPAVTTVAVLCFLGSWNDLLVAMLWLPDTGLRTISVGVATLAGVRANSIDLILTGSLFSAIPPILAFIIFQRYLVSGIVSGIGK
ncbi:MAG: carbohydrate ABC transporter permease [Devosia nanyangense]|uniref:sn-glycerol-3-phosphate transport system permease protein UgpE n=1 Tax=Devosia nanyangense TaxID=1228055 RepID=A0A933NYX0_9HYPH|nr:carbohydrate ABC transporter permease [Devosia nanyangense]